MLFRSIEVNFEDSVSDPIKIGKKLFSQLNLDIDEKILDQVEIEKLLDKAKKLNEQIDFYKNYERFLGPLKKGLNLL